MARVAGEILIVATTLTSCKTFNDIGYDNRRITLLLLLFNKESRNTGLPCDMCLQSGNQIKGNWHHYLLRLMSTAGSHSICYTSTSFAYTSPALVISAGCQLPICCRGLIFSCHSLSLIDLFIIGVTIDLFTN